MREEIRIIVKEPHKDPEVKVIPNTLRAMQKIVGGHLDSPIPAFPGVVVMANEEGILLDLPYNCLINGHNLFGTIFWVGILDDQLVSLDDGWIDTILHHTYWTA